MKKIKLLASLLAVGAVSTMLATASFAADFTVSSTYTEGTEGAADTVTLSGLDNYTADNAVGEYTVVFLTEDATTVTDENLVYVMQGTKEEIATAKITGLTEGATYYVRVGGSSTGFAKGTFTVPGGSTAEQVLVGSLSSLTDAPTASDAAEILSFKANKNSVISEDPKNRAFYAAAYCDGDAKVTSADAAEILNFKANKAYNPNVNTLKAIGSIAE